MAELHLTGTSAGTILQANNSITSNQTFTFPDTGGEIVVTPGTADIESGQITATVNNASGDDSALKAVQTNVDGYAIWSGSGPTAANRTFTVLPNGTISAAGTLTINSINPASNSGNGANIYTDLNQTALNIQSPNTVNASNPLIRGYYGTGNTFLVTADGSITAAGDITGATANFRGIKSRNGVNGSWGSNSINLFWTSSATLEAWVDTTNLGNISILSDYRIKREVKPMESGAIPRVKKLNPVSYKLDNFGNLVKRSDSVLEGFIAHEVQEVIPSGATGSKDCEHQIQSLKLDSVLAVTVKALQEAVDRIEALEAEVQALKGGAS